MSDLNAAATPPNNPPPFWQTVTLKQVAQGTAIAALILLGILLFIALRYVLVLLFLSIVLATALAPLTERLRRWGVSQALAVLAAFSLLVLAVAGILAAVVPFFANQIAQLATDLPERYAAVRGTIA